MTTEEKNVKSLKVRPSGNYKNLQVERYPGEPTRFLVESQTRKIKHLVDSDPWSCGCEWSNDFAIEGECKTWCAHILAVRWWYECNAETPKTSLGALTELRAWRPVVIPQRAVAVFRKWLARHDPKMLRRVRTISRQDSVIFIP